ncbi:MAG TPA: hypothetical protein ENK04_04000 [Gammaproteobacteria bacterium]|nr:hypothetical protein [Gammaproteobacteria bacterium]
MERLSAEIRPVTSLSNNDVHDMFELYDAYYDASDIQCFEHDMGKKDYVVLLKDQEGVFRGFSTLAVYEFDFDNRERRVLYSGDTIIHHEFWGSQALPLAWCQMAGKLKAEVPDKPLYWFLIVKGHRTYRYLSIFAKRFYPTWRYETPAETQAMIDHLARQKFGDDYKHDKGVVQFKQSRGHLRKNWVEIPEYMRKKPDVRYFLQRNPGHARGDELVCLTELCQGNLRSHALRAFREALRQ